MFLEHSLLVSDVMVALAIACRKNGRVRLLTGKELPLPESLRAHRQPFKWTVTAKKNKLGVIPDAAFALEFLDQPSDRNRVLFFLEADCGTMPATRASLAQSSFYRKLLAYEATWAQELHRQRFGFNRFRVITVTHSPARVTSLVQACCQLSRGHGLFLFIEIASLIANPDLLTRPFQTGHGGKVATLLE
jgi:hypothetical protein